MYVCMYVCVYIMYMYICICLTTSPVLHHLYSLRPASFPVVGCVLCEVTNIIYIAIVVTDYHARPTADTRLWRVESDPRYGRAAPLHYLTVKSQQRYTDIVLGYRGNIYREYTRLGL